MAYRGLGLLLIVVALGQAGCSESRQPPMTGQGGGDRGILSVYVVNYPLEYFAQRIGGEYVKVGFPAPADEDPAFWVPDPETIAAYQQADLILLNGATYAKWIDKVSLPESKLRNTSSSFTAEYIGIEGALTHSHGPEGEHAHGEIAFTTWLDPKLAIEQARAVCKAFSQRRPELASRFQANLAELEKDLLELDTALEKALAGLEDTPVIFSHPVYQYFQRRYGLNGRSVHWEPDEMPTAEQWSELEELLKTHVAKLMIWEGRPIRETVIRLAETGIKSVVFDPCGNTPKDGDYLTVLRENLNSLAEE